VHAYRILHVRYAKTPLDGEGSFRYGGRWNNIGTRLAYTSSTISLAQLEYLVSLPEELLPTGLVVAVADVPDDLIETFDTSALPRDWRDIPAPSETQAIGDQWARTGTKPVLAVPSVFVPLDAVDERNCLINPLHRGFSRIKLLKPIPFAYDARLKLPRERHRR